MSALNDRTSKEEKESRKARLDLRLTPKEKQILAEAAAHEDMDVSAFVRRTVLTRAQEIIGQAERIRVTERDFYRLLELLENPPQPSPALKKAVADKYGQR
jgi:uncharacterized protein (DUF1778 family)